MSHHEIPRRITAAQAGEATGNDTATRRGLAQYGGNFALLDQTGPFAIGDGMNFGDIRSWSKNLSLGQETLFFVARNNIHQLATKSFLSMSEDFGDPQRRTEASLSANLKIAELYGLSGSDAEITSKLETYALTADEIRTYVARVLRRPMLFEPTNEVVSTADPRELIRLLFRSRDRKIRFEAESKLTTIMMVAANDQREREETERRLVALTSWGRRSADPDRKRIVEDPKLQTGFERNFSQFQEFLDAHVFGSDETPADTTVLKSNHRPEDFRCVTVIRLPQRQAEMVLFRRPPRGSRYTELKERRFTHLGREVRGYFTPRKKTTESTALKLFRKGKTNPWEVEDTIGLKAVLENKDDIRAFRDRLIAGANEAGLLFVIEELEDTLDGTPYSAQNPGSSPSLRTLKFIARIGGMRVEFLIFDHPGYIDSLYRDGVSRPEFEVNRLYDSGVVDFFFPEEIYFPKKDSNLNHAKLRASLIKQIRRQIRDGH